MRHVVSLSGGTASAFAAERVIQRVGIENVTLWFADTKWEDEDLYRFLNDLEQLWGKAILRAEDGRTPLQVAEDRKLIPNQRRAPCSLVLKIEPFTKWLKKQPKPITVYLGLDWTEPHRHATPKKRYEEIDGVTVEYPLMWEPIEARPYFDIVRDDWGIDPPRLYKLGFPHNNCGGRCVRQGHAEWHRLKTFFPERFVEVRDWEQEQRNKGGARANYAITRDQRNGTVKPLPLADLEKLEFTLTGAPKTPEDMFGCFCEY